MLRDRLPPGTEGTSSQMGCLPVMPPVEVKHEVSQKVDRKRAFSFLRSMRSIDEVIDIDADSSPEKKTKTENGVPNAIVEDGTGDEMVNSLSIEEELAELFGSPPSECLVGFVPSCLVSIMKSYVPKKGRSRMYARPSGRPRVLKRPSACKYVPEPVRVSRHSKEADRVKPSVTVEVLLKMHTRKLSSMLRKMKLMQNLNRIGKKCAVCGVCFGKSGRCLNRNCSALYRRAKALHKDDYKYIISSHHQAADIHMQAVTTLCGVIGIGAAQSHMLTGMDHKM
eukprot:1953053-Amphidinium_carterae.1